MKRVSFPFSLWAVLSLTLLTLACAKHSDQPPLKIVLSKDMPEKELTYKWDARSPNVIYIIHPGWNNTIFDLHIFEDLLVPARDWPTKHFINNRRLNEKLFEWKRDGEGYAYHIRQRELVNYEMSGTVRTTADQVIVEGQITNQDTMAWGKENGAALMCLRCRLDPSFRDPLGERIFLLKTDGGERHSVFELQGHRTKYYNFFRKEDVPVYQNRLLKVNQPGTRSVTMETTPCISLGGNREDSTSCIHANVSLIAKPGETVHYKTVITFSEPRAEKKK